MQSSSENKRLPLYEQARPQQWSEVVGQDAAVNKLLALQKRSGFGGRMFYITGKSGTGKTTIAKLIAADVADQFSTIEVGGPQVTAEFIDTMERYLSGKPLGGRGWAIIVNEVQSFKRGQIDRLLQMLENIPEHAVWVFTTTCTGDTKLFDDMDEAPAFLSRAFEVSLSQRDLCKVFAARAQTVATQAGLNGQPIAKYERLAKECGNNLRMMGFVQKV